MPKLVLASASPRRKELLGLLQLEFEVVPSEYEEIQPETHPDPAELTIHLASEKARDVARRRPDALVLGADTLVALDNRLYGKPKGPENAARMLRELSGRTHTVVTGVALIPPGDGEREIHTLACQTQVQFRPLDEAEIAAYAASGEPLDKAGAYAIQGFGAMFIQEIRGDYPNVVGLPLTPLVPLLRRLGIPILGL